MRTFSLYINGNFIHGNLGQAGQLRPVTSPGDDGETFAQIAWLDDTPENCGLIEAALLGAQETFAQVQQGFFPLAERLAFLERLKHKLFDNLDFTATLICKEVGKPLRLARTEVNRSISTIEWTLLEAPGLFTAHGLPTRSRADSQGLEGWTLREARGPLLAISPFNFPLNLVMHKLAPAIAAGCPVILKPSPKAAATALALADLCHACSLPAGMLSVLNCDDALTARLLKDDRIAQVSFTGSARVGWHLKSQVTKPFALELGGNAPVFVDASADLKRAATNLVQGGLAYAGQLCIAVQNIAVHREVAKAFRELLAEEVARFPWGRPMNEATLAGGVIDRTAAQRLNTWRQEALQVGARIVSEAAPAADLAPTDAERAGTFVRPALFENVSPQSRLYKEEMFGPYLNLTVRDEFDAWLAEVNAQPARFQAALFTGNLKTAYRAANELRFGAVLVNEPTHMRFEPMPFGGRGLSGEGREGPRYAIESFTELKSILLRP